MCLIYKCILLFFVCISYSNADDFVPYYDLTPVAPVVKEETPPKKEEVKTIQYKYTSPPKNTQSRRRFGWRIWRFFN